MELLRPVQGLSQSTDFLHCEKFTGPVFLVWVSKDVHVLETCAVPFRMRLTGTTGILE